MTSIELNNAVVTWNPYVREANDSHFLHYNIKLVPLQSPNQEIVMRTEENEKLISGLSPNTGYSVSVQTVTVKGESLFSDPHDFQTKALSEQDAERILKLESKALKLESRTSNLEEALEEKVSTTTYNAKMSAL